MSFGWLMPPGAHAAGCPQRSWTPRSNLSWSPEAEWLRHLHAKQSCQDLATLACRGTFSVRALCAPSLSASVRAVLRSSAKLRSPSPGGAPGVPLARTLHPEASSWSAITLLLPERKMQQAAGLHVELKDSLEIWHAFW